MAKNLGIPAAHKDLRCLACHTTPQIAQEQSKLDYPLDLGVGCESCHGSASPKWLGIHTTEAWKNTPSAAENRTEPSTRHSDSPSRSTPAVDCCDSTAFRASRSHLSSRFPARRRREGLRTPDGDGMGDGSGTPAIELGAK